MQNSIVVITSNTVYILLTFIIVTVIVLCTEVFSHIVQVKKSNINKRKQQAPGPRALPIIGNLATLDGYEVPYQAFTDLACKYGPIISLQLGRVPTLVVNGIENIREVLITKTGHFDSRPDFRRYHQLFAGNKENSLAFCDWSDLHKLRRDMLIPHTFPKHSSCRFQDLNGVIINEISSLISTISDNQTRKFEIKNILLKTSANIFTQYFCSKQFDTTDSQFEKLIKNFDKIFYEVNQGYAADFLPFLMPFHKKNLNQMEKWSHEIRDIILEKIIGNRFEMKINEEKDYVDSLIRMTKESQDQESSNFSKNTALFALEDIIGGHSAVGNFLTKVFAYLVENPKVQKEIQNEIDAILPNNSNEEIIGLEYRNQMPYTQAVIMEALRLIASPIVPHVSNQDTTVNGYDVKANTLVFLNNYELSMSDKLWNSPGDFKPERFLKSGLLVKPDFFLPFGAGRRSCMGYKLVQFISFAILANIMKTHNIRPLENENYKVQIGSLAVPEKSFHIYLEPRLQC